MILNTVGAGGDGGFNFSVKAYSSEASVPTTAAENTIAVITSTAIPSYVFSSTQPTSPSAGMVWIMVGSSGDGFNALGGKNTLNVYPLIIQQYVNSTWVVKASKIYQNGKWKSLFDGVFLNGGTLTKAYPHTEKKVPSGSAVKYESDGIYCYTVAKSVSEIYAVFGPVDLSDVKTLRADGQNLYTKDGTVTHVLFVATSNSASYTGAKAIATYRNDSAVAQNKFSQTLNVSHLTGNHYIFIGTHTMGAVWGNQRSVKYTKLTMEW